MMGEGYQKKNSAKLNESHFPENHMALYTDNAQPEGESSSSALLEKSMGIKKTRLFLWRLNWEVPIF